MGSVRQEFQVRVELAQGMAATAKTRRQGRLGWRSVTEVHINGTKRRVEADAERSLLSVLRDDLDLTGRKYGCSEAGAGPALS